MLGINFISRTRWPFLSLVIITGEGNVCGQGPKHPARLIAESIPENQKKKKKALNKTNTYVVINSICLQQKGQSRYFNPVAELAIPNDRSILYNPTKRGVLGILSVITLSSYSVQYQVLRSMAKSYMIKLAWLYSLQVLTLCLPCTPVKYRTRGSNQQVAKLPTLVALSIITRPSLISAFSRSRLRST